MKKKTAIVVDSACDLTDEQLCEHHISMIALRIVAEGREYRDRVDLDTDAIYNMLSGELPKTSLPAPEDITSVYAALKEEGYDEIVHLCLSSGLSGTYNLVRLLAEGSPLPVHPVDTRTLSAGLGMLTLLAAGMAESGADAKTIAEAVEKMRAEQMGMFVIPTLEYLRKGGRIGRVEGAIGQLLQLRPVVYVNDEGRYETIVKSRGQKHSVEKMAQEAIKRFEGRKVHLWLVHGRALESAQVLSVRLKGLMDVADVHISPVSPVLAVHTGPGLVGVIAAPVLDGESL